MKAVYQSIEEIPEALRSEYEDKGGSFVLKVDGDLPQYSAPLTEARSAAEDAKAKLASFRENNVKLLKELGAASFEDAVERLKILKSVDPAEYNRLKSRTSELEQQGIRTPEDVTRIFMEKTREQVAAAVKPLQDRLNEITARERAAQEQLARTTLENALREAASKSGVDERAVPDFLARGLQIFTLKDGQVVAQRGDQPLFSRRKPGEALTPEEWANDLSADAPHLFRPSKGGGATGGTGAPKKRYIGQDPLEFGSNLDAIAKGEVVVQGAQF
jgi:hypothetical protein